MTAPEEISFDHSEPRTIPGGWDMSELAGVSPARANKPQQNDPHAEWFIEHVESLRTMPGGWDLSDVR
jgi:hypothetical protein